MRKLILIISFSLYLVCPGVPAFAKNIVADVSPHDLLVQTSTIDALLSGLYDGQISAKELLSHGNLGIGTFHRLEGEMVVLDGNLYQVKADGKVYRPNQQTTSPFAAVCQFNPDHSLTIKGGTDFKALKTLLDAAAPNRNLFWAFKIEAKFRYMKTRSVPAQTKPYPPLAQVTANQPEFQMQDVSGTLVGFRCPPFVKGINVPGYHLHFISSDFTQGGHVLGFEITTGHAEIDRLNRFLLLLPAAGSDFQQVDLSLDRSRTLNQVENEAAKKP